MKLIRYKVTNFRSVKDSGWIECSDVTTLVGINEAGKSNLLLALWKLNPAKDGEIDPLHDLPLKFTPLKEITYRILFSLQPTLNLVPLRQVKFQKWLIALSTRHLLLALFGILMVNMPFLFRNLVQKPILMLLKLYFIYNKRITNLNIVRKLQKENQVLKLKL